MADIYTTMIGNVTADPTIRHTNNNKAVTNVSLACNHRTKDAQGAWTDGAATFVSGTIWEEMALNVCDSLRKGQEVAMTGWLYTEEFTRQDGTQGSGLKMRVDHIGPTLRWGTAQFQRVDRRNGGQPQQSGQPQGGGFGAQPQQPSGQQVSTAGTWTAPQPPAQDPWGGQPSGDWGTPSQSQEVPF